jgi:antitoxin (DNA-binding transcriptional repressor) of toxin-antitoxin stability system
MIHKMKTATVRQLRTEFPRIENWLAEGERVAITKRKVVVAELMAPQRPKPDFAKRFGGRPPRRKSPEIGAVTLLLEERGE